MKLPSKFPVFLSRTQRQNQKTPLILKFLEGKKIKRQYFNLEKTELNAQKLKKQRLAKFFNCFCSVQLMGGTWIKCMHAYQLGIVESGAKWQVKQRAR